MAVGQRQDVVDNIVGKINTGWNHDKNKYKNNATKSKHASHDTISRLRIGHRLVHFYLLSGDDIPECGTCQCPLTVKHILMECVDFNDVRNKHFVASSIKDLFDNIKETRFYKQL